MGGRNRRTAAVDGGGSTLPYGSSGEHQGLPGTLSIGADAFRHVVVELTRSAANDFEAVVFVCGHAGNHRPLSTAVEQLTTEGHRVAALFPAWPELAEGRTDAHAGRTETSLLLHLWPELVRLELAAPGATEPLADLMERLVAEGVAAVSPNGVLGDPTGASAEEGRRLMAALIHRGVELVERLTTEH